jgi:DNA-binding MarR family transcriptional regulator
VSDLDASGFEAAATDRVRSHPGDLDLVSFAAMFDLLRASTRIFGHLESVVHRPAGWSLAGFRIMFTLWVAGPLEVRDIARLSGLSRASVSAALNTLERDGLAVRLPHPTDGRLVVADLTPDGRRRLEVAYAHQNEMERSLLGDLDDAEVRVLISLLRRLLDVAPEGHASLSSKD